MAAMDVEALLKRAEAADKRRQAFSMIMQDCYAYAMPQRDAWSTYGEGQDRNLLVYDSTAVVAVPRFANRLQQALFPPQQRWARLALPPELADDEGLQQEQVNLEAATDLAFRHIHGSNFDAAIAEWGQDLAAGVGCLLVEDGRFGQRRSRGPRLRFQAVPAAMVAFDEGPWGNVEGVFFRQRVKARLIERTYPDASNLPPALRSKMTQEPDHEVELMQCTTYDAADDVWRFEVLLCADKVRIVARSYRTCPWIITRWTKAPGETHGRGPLVQALADIRTLNKVVELSLAAAALAIGGVYTAEDDGVLNPDTVVIAPGAIIPVRSNGGPGRGGTLRRLDEPTNFALSEALQQQLRTNIRQMLFDDPLPPEVQAGLTATEVIERVRRFQSETGAFGRLQTDAVTPLMTRVIDILEEAGEFADPRFAGIMDALKNDIVRILATSPLAQAQDRADVQATLSFVQAAMQMGEPGMRMLESGIDLDAAGPWVAARSGVPHHLIPSKESLDKRREAAAQQAQQAQVLQSPAVAQVAGALAGAAARGPAQEAA
jgi:hypothetical protein